MLLSQRVRDLLEGLGLVDGDGASPTYYVGTELSEPDFAVTILPSPGPAPRRTLEEQPVFTVRVRHPSGEEANAFLRQIFQALQEYQGRLGSSPVLPVARLRASASPVPLGRDSEARQGRYVVSQTFSAIVRQVF